MLSIFEREERQAREKRDENDILHIVHYYLLWLVVRLWSVLRTQLNLT